MSWSVGILGHMRQRLDACGLLLTLRAGLGEFNDRARVFEIQIAAVPEVGSGRAKVSRREVNFRQRQVDLAELQMEVDQLLEQARQAATAPPEP